MKFSQAYGPGRFGLSFELFPPKTPAGMENLLIHMERLSRFNPDLVTCTYGAGGSMQDRTLEVIEKVQSRFPLAMATHLTCVGRTADQLRDYVGRAVALGVQNVVALRGDPPKGESAFTSTSGGFSHANELVSFLRNEFEDIGIAVAGYPETHQEAPSAEVDLENLRRKVDAGADVVLTQLFYDNRDFFDFRERCEKSGIGIPIVPGLLPVTNVAQIQRIASLCGAKLPKPLVGDLERHADNPEGQLEVGVAFARHQTEALLEAEVPGIHYYVLNKSAATERVLNSVTLPR